MIIVYTPAGGEAEQYDAQTLKVSEVSIVQRTIDMKWGEIKAGLAVEDLDAMRGIAWVIKKRSQPALRWSEFDPGITELVTRMDNDEVRNYIKGAAEVMAEDPDADWDAVRGALGEIADAAIDPEFARAQIAAAMAGPKEAPVEQPEAAPEQAPPVEPSPSPNPTSSTPETPTSDSSPTSATPLQQPSMT